MRNHAAEALNGVCRGIDVARLDNVRKQAVRIHRKRRRLTLFAENEYGQKQRGQPQEAFVS
jgi:hypothetical protein